MTDHSQLVKTLRQLARDMVKLDMDMSLPAGSANPEDAADAIDALQARVEALEAGLRPYAEDKHPLKNTHLLSWLAAGHTHCHNGTRDWAQGYLDSAIYYIQAFEADARALLERKLP